MNPNDLDRLLHDLRDRRIEAPSGIVDGVISRLGPSSRQTRTALWAGATACVTAVVLSATIAMRVAPGIPETAPPELTLLTRGVDPLASL